jgi:hypothetical protein
VVDCVDRNTNIGVNGEVFSFDVDTARLNLSVKNRAGGWRQS